MSELQTASSANLQMTSPTTSVALPLALIAAANPASRVRRTRQLEDRGFRVAVARTGFEAIVKASCQMPDLIVLDESLGELEVAETARLLTICPVTAHTPVLCLRARRKVPSRVLAGLRRCLVI